MILECCRCILDDAEGTAEYMDRWTARIAPSFFERAIPTLRVSFLSLC